MPAKTPVTRAIRHLRAADVEYEPFTYDYERHEGAEGAAAALGLDPHHTVKTIVFRTSEGAGVIVLMNGDREVSTKSLARLLGVKSVDTASDREARRWTGYEFGGTSPFGTRTKLPVHAHDGIAELDEIYINGGRRGFLVKISTEDLRQVLNPLFGDLSV